MCAICLVEASTATSPQQQPQAESGARVMSSPVTSLCQPLNDFSVSLFQRLAASVGQENLCTSPLGISCALTALLLGAKNDSEQQIKRGLRLHQLHKPTSDVHHLFHEVRLTSSAPGGRVNVMSCRSSADQWTDQE